MNEMKISRRTRKRYAYGVDEVSRQEASHSHLDDETEGFHIMIEQNKRHVAPSCDR